MRVISRHDDGRGGWKLDRQYDGTSSSLRAARTDIVSWLDDHGVEQELQERAALVLSELTTNAVQCAPGSAYEVRASLPDSSELVVAVVSHSRYEQPPPREHWRPASLTAPRGRGLMIVDDLSDAVDIDLHGRDTVVVTATLRS